MTIAIDFDGTIVTHAYPAIGKPIPFAIETLKKLQQEDHHQLILWTCREGELLQEAIDYCTARGLEFYAVNSNFPEETVDIVRARKLEADLFIDDRKENVEAAAAKGIRTVHFNRMDYEGSCRELRKMLL